MKVLKVRVKLHSEEFLALLQGNGVDLHLEISIDEHLVEFLKGEMSREGIKAAEVQAELDKREQAQ